MEPQYEFTVEFRFGIKHHNSHRHDLSFLSWSESWPPSSHPKHIITVNTSTAKRMIRLATPHYSSCLPDPNSELDLHTCWLPSLEHGGNPGFNHWAHRFNSDVWPEPWFAECEWLLVAWMETSCSPLSIQPISPAAHPVGSAVPHGGCLQEAEKVG